MSYETNIRSCRRVLKGSKARGRASKKHSMNRSISKQKRIVDEPRNHDKNLERLLNKRIAELERTETRFQRYVKEANDLIFTLDVSGKITSANRATSEVTGYSVDELLGKDPLGLVVPEARASVRAALRKVTRGERVQRVEAEITSKDGHRIILEVRGRLIHEGRRRVGTFYVARDVTERKRVESKLRESQAEYKSLFEESPIPLWLEDHSEVKKALERLRSSGITDLTTYFQSNPDVVRDLLNKVKILDVNQAALQLHEAATKEIYQEGLSKFFIGETYSSFGKQLAAMAEGSTKFHNETTISTFSGKKKQVSLTWAVAPGHEKSFSKVFVSYIDITDRKRAEEKLNALHGHALQLSTASTANEIVERTLDVVEFTLGFDHADFCEVRDGSVYIRASRGMPVMSTKLPTHGPSVIVKVAKTKKTLWVPETRKEPAFLDTPAIGPSGELLHMLSELTVPVLVGDKVVAVLNIESTRVNAFTERDQKLLETLAMHVASALGRLGQSERLEKLVAALQESESRYRALFDNASDAIFIHDMGDRFLEVNQVACERLGYSREELLQMTPEGIDSPEYAGFVAGRVEELRRVGQAFFETAHVRRDGTIIPVELSSRVIEYKGKAAVLSIARDITERKRAEDALRGSEERYRLLFEKSPIGIGLSSLDGKVISANDAMQAITGYSLEELNRISLADTYENPADRKQLLDSLKQNGSVVDFPTRLKRKDGIPYDALLNVSRIRVAGKDFVQTTCIDVTERKLAEDALRRRAEELAALRATVLDITGPHDLTTLLQTVIERATRLLHAPGGGMYLCDADKQEARCVVSYNTPGDYTGTTLKYGQGAAGIVAQTGKPLIIDDYRTWQGRAPAFEGEKPFMAVLTVPMIWQTQVTGVIHVLDNTSSRKFTQADQGLLTLLADHAAIAVENARLLEQAQHQAEELKHYSTNLERLVLERTKRLADSEKRFRELADLLPQIVFEIDTEGRFSYVNRVGLASIGYTEDDLRGLNAFQMFTAEEHDRAKENIRRILNGESVGTTEYTAVRKDGSRFPLIVYVSRVVREGKPVGLRGIAVDITERKQMEQRLLRAERLAAIGELAAMVGHDLRNPLAGMGGAAYYLRTKLGPTIGSREKEMLEVIEQSIERSDKIVSDLLEYSGELRLESTVTDAKSITRETLTQIKVPTVIRVVDSTENEPKISVDTEKMRRVFLNLIQNAFEAMPQGGTLTIASAKRNGNVQITFDDTGVGMTRELLERVWSPLFTTKAKGMGLGLPIAKRFVEGHRGSISVESQAGKGSTFTVTLPIASKQEEGIRE